MEIHNRFLADCVIVDLTEAEFGYPKTVLLKNHVGQLLQNGYHRVVLNLSQVDMLDSFGIAVLVSLFKLCKEHRGNLTLYGLNEQVNHLIELTHMDRILDIWESENQAVRQVKAISVAR